MVLDEGKGRAGPSGLANNGVNVIPQDEEMGVVGADKVFVQQVTPVNNELPSLSRLSLISFIFSPSLTLTLTLTLTLSRLSTLILSESHNRSLTNPKPISYLTSSLSPPPSHVIEYCKKHSEAVIDISIGENDMSVALDAPKSCGAPDFLNCPLNDNDLLYDLTMRPLPPQEVGQQWSGTTVDH
ncbi:uncharacterized protein G2W53_028863 [Senna tora]|uniref:Uncharacterized protein n=1 Tax=Senna tora TaxID=362788 RepID=A0A834WF67_9FABA|nr:uncharacterized protein G2W53_028863 [Senna tora]